MALAITAVATGCAFDAAPGAAADPGGKLDEATGDGLDEAAFDAGIAFFLVRGGKLQKRLNGGVLTVNADWDLDLRPFSEGGAGGANFGGTPTDIRIGIVGGLARSPVMTRDGLAGVLCHEFGHGSIEDPPSDDCLADYFGVRHCLRELFATQPKTNKAALADLDAPDRALCKDAFTNREDEALCGRVLSAGLHVFDYLEWLRLEFADIEVPGFEEQNLLRLESMRRAAAELPADCED